MKLVALCALLCLAYLWGRHDGRRRWEDVARQVGFAEGATVEYFNRSHCDHGKTWNEDCQQCADEEGPWNG